MPIFRNNKSHLTIEQQREKMVRDQLMKRDITDPYVLQAMRTVPRHMFVDRSQCAESYDDGPLSIGHGQTISQPYIVASMTQELNLHPESRVLEIGTGCGYQAAVLAEIALDVYSVEIVPELFKESLIRLDKMRYENVHLKLGDGNEGWPEHAPFDGIIITAAAPHIPEKLIAQLAPNGTMILPLGQSFHLTQDLIKIEKKNNRLEQTSLYSVRFVPMTGGVNA